MRIITTQQRRGLGLAVACKIVTMNNLSDLRDSNSGNRYHIFLNLVFQGLAPNERVATAFNKQWLQDAKAALAFLPREQVPSVQRFNATCFMFREVYDQMKVAELGDQHLMALYKANEAWVGKRSVLQMPGHGSTTDQATEQAAHMLFFAAKGIGYYKDVDTFDGVTVL